MRERPRGIVWIAGLLLAAAIYLAVLGVAGLASPGALPMRFGAPLLQGLELAGPWMYLLVAAITAATSVGLAQLWKWARWATILASLLGILALVPDVSAAVVSLQPGALARGGAGVILRVIVAWYLFQEPVKSAFDKQPDVSLNS